MSETLTAKISYDGATFKLVNVENGYMSWGASVVRKINAYDANQKTIRQQAETIKALREALESATNEVEQCATNSAATWAKAHVATIRAEALVGQFRAVLAQTKGE